jgi:hypothetical protein
MGTRTSPVASATVELSAPPGSTVADATQANHPTFIRGLKPTAKIKRRYAAKEDCKSPSKLNTQEQSAVSHLVTSQYDDPKYL